MAPTMEYGQQLLLLFARHSAVFLMIPVFSLRALPVTVRLALAGLVSVAVMPPEAAISNPVPGDYGYFLALGKETLLGVFLGFGLQLTFAGLQGAGALVDMQLGFSMAEVVDPASGARDSLMGAFYHLLAAYVFFAVDAHHQVVLALRYLLQVAPLDHWAMGPGTVEGFLSLSAALFTVAVRMALPVLAATLVVDVALALATRLVPQLQPYYVGQPLKIGLGLLVVLLGAPLWASLAGGVFSGLGKDAIVLAGAVRP